MGQLAAALAGRENSVANRFPTCQTLARLRPGERLTSRGLPGRSLVAAPAMHERGTFIREFHLLEHGVDEH